MSWLLLRKIGTEKGKREEGRGKKKDREREEGRPLELNDEAVPLFHFPSSFVLRFARPRAGHTRSRPFHAGELGHRQRLAGWDPEDALPILDGSRKRIERDRILRHLRNAFLHEIVDRECAEVLRLHRR